MSTSGKLPTNPLEGRRILVTRAAEQAEAFQQQLRRRGAVPVECPTIQLVPPPDWAAVDAAIRDLAGFDWLILTSVNGVRFFLGRMQELGKDVQELKNCRVCAVGPKTADALAAQGITPDLLPEQFTGEGVVAAFQGIDLQGRQVLFPKADGARDLIPQQLRSMGAAVVDPVVYRNIMPVELPEAARQALEQHQLAAVVFSSPSTVRNLTALAGGITRLKEMLHGMAVASIGPVTTRACQELGLVVAVEPEQATLDSLLDGLEQFFAKAEKPRQ